MSRSSTSSDNQTNSRPSHRGFSIVELCIVIVTITILISIVMAAYNVVGQSVNNSSIRTGVKIYEKALTQYATNNGAYPDYSGAGVCLGSGYPNNQCWSGSGGNILGQTSVDNVLAPYIGATKPTLSTKILKTTNAPDHKLGAIFVVYRGPIYQLVYYMEGSGQQCLDSNIGESEIEATQCRITLPNPVDIE